jgi:predicted PurR-regulated permease PerM
MALIVSQVLMGLLVGIVGVAIATPLAAVLIELVRETCVERDVPGQQSSTSQPAQSC